MRLAHTEAAPGERAAVSPSLVRFLVVHCLAGVIAGWTMVGGLLSLNVAGLGGLVMTSDLFPVPLLMLLAAFAITFGGRAAGSAIMGLGRSGGAAGVTGHAFLRPAPPETARRLFPGLIRAVMRKP
jgi:hypothetical protein